MGEAKPEAIVSAQTLVGALDAALSKQNFAKRVRDRLGDCRVKAASVLEELIDIHENYAPLPTIKEEERPLSIAREAWNALSAGEIDAFHEDAVHLRGLSPSLRTMFQAGIDFQDFYRYSAEEFAVSTELGNAFEKVNGVWDYFKREIGNSASGFEFQQSNFEEVRSFVAMMKRCGVIGEYEFWTYVFPKKEWEAVLKPDRIPYFRNPRLRVSVSDIAPQLMKMVNGHWLTAFAYKIVDDHLSRNNFDFEIYSQVRYKTAEGIENVRGDFDVLARSQGRILAIECKSGRLRERAKDDRRDFMEIVTKAERLKAAFEATRSEVNDISFWLVYNPYLNNPESIQKRLNGSMVLPLTPNEIRGEVRKHFLGDSLREPTL